MIRERKKPTRHLQESEAIVLYFSIVFRKNPGYFPCKSLPVFFISIPLSILNRRIRTLLRSLIESSHLKIFCGLVNKAICAVFLVKRAANSEHIDALSSQICSHWPSHGLLQTYRHLSKKELKQNSKPAKQNMSEKIIHRLRQASVFCEGMS